jgi:CHAT domain-containing protein/tetratricopeptide (TPR) repeat protein
MILKWYHAIAIIFLMISICIQIGFAENSIVDNRHEYDRSSDFDKIQAEDSNSVYTPLGFKNDTHEAQRLEDLRKKNVTVIDDLIRIYENILANLTPGRYLIFRAGIDINLATAYKDRIYGDRAENLEKAIQLYNDASKIYTRKSNPPLWAVIENNLGNAYSNRRYGDPAENLKKAIQHYNNALEIYAREGDSINWSMTENNLGGAYYSERRFGSRAEDLEKAIQYYNKALEIYTLKEYPEDWAMTENNLGIAYSERIVGNHSDNLEKAIQHYNNSLKIRTLDADPVEWAETENNLGIAYSNRILGNHSENLEKAIDHYQRALKIRTASSLPRDFRDTEWNLGNLYFEQDRWQEALDAYKKGIAVGDLLYRSSLSAESKSAEIKEDSVFYKNATFAAVKLNKTTDAFLTLDHGKTRVLTEALRLNMQRPEGVSIPNDSWTKYERAAIMYRTLQATPLPEMDSGKGMRDKERNTREALEAMNAALKDIQRFAPSFQKDIEFSDIQNTLDESTALLSFCVTSKGSLLFVVTRSGISLLDIPGFNTTDLNRLVFETDAQGHIIGGWVGNISSSMNTTITEATIDQVLAEIGRQLVEPAIAEIPDNVKKLIILPSGSLFLLPIHAAPIGKDKRLCDRYVVSYAPSIELLIEMREKAKDRVGKGLYAVINPTENLYFTACEGENISRLFPDHLLDTGSKCTLASVLNGTRGRAYLHFSCHGIYNWNDPPQSALILYNRSPLTLADLEENDSLLLSARLVTLSACETGVTDILVGSADEYVGLPAGFMLAGAPCVVSSLWPVDDASTSLLMERFYSNHITKGMDIPQALQEAQHWVRGLTAKEVAEYVKDCCSSSECSKTKYFIHLKQNLTTMDPQAMPFAHPYYWAGFIAIGA